MALLPLVQCVHGSTDILRHTITPLYDDISKIRMFLSTQHVCGFILVYVTHWCDAYTLDNRAQQIDLCFKHILSENTVRFAIFAFDIGAVLGWIVVVLPPS